MCAKARVVIKRENGNIFLWNAGNGDFEGVGREICYELQDLLNEYTVNELVRMISEIKFMNKNDLSDNELEFGFDASELNKFIKGEIAWINDKFHDYHYEYVIDIYNQRLLAKGIAKQVVLSFDDIKNGRKVHKVN